MRTLSLALAVLLAAIVTTGCASTAQGPSDVVSPGVVPGATAADMDCSAADCDDCALCVIVCGGDEPCEGAEACMVACDGDQDCGGDDCASCMIACGGEEACVIKCGDAPCEPAGNCCPAGGDDG